MCRRNQLLTVAANNLVTIDFTFNCSHEYKFADDCLQYFPGERDFRKTARESVKFLRQYGQSLLNERISMIRRGDSVPQDILTYIIKCKGTC